MASRWTLQLSAEDLKISMATLRNWQRTGTLPLFQEPEVSFPLSDDQQQKLRQQIISSGRLQKRAHRLYHRGNSSPSSLGQRIQDLNRTDEELIFLLAKGILEEQSLSLEQKKASFQELDRWEGNCRGSVERSLIEEILQKSPLDPLGYFIEVHHPIHKRIEEGRYFTPFPILRQMFRDFRSWNGGGNFLDPALGSGRFILSYLQAGGDPARCFGLEKDPLSLKAARFNFLQQCLPPHGEIPLYSGDSLKMDQERIPWGDIDWVMTNPPWGSLNRSRRKEYIQGKVWDRDLFGLFIHLAVTQCKAGGGFSFILPQSILSQKKHLPLRQYLLDQGTLQSIRLWENRFPGVQSPPITLTWRKGGRPSSLKLLFPRRNFTRPQGSLKQELTWDIHLDRKDKLLEKKLCQKAGGSIKDHHPQWMLGLVTGNNRKFMNQQGVGEPLIRGRDIQSGLISEPTSFLHQGLENLQQKAPEKLYRSPCKVVYRFISPYPNAALDRRGRLLLNSANALVLPREREMELLVLLMNSRLYRYLFKRKYSVMKILRSHLEELPFPQLRETEWKQLEIFSPSTTKNQSGDFDSWLESYYQLDQREIERIEKDQTDMPAG